MLILRMEKWRIENPSLFTCAKKKIQNSAYGILGGIQQLLNVHVDPNLAISESMSYYGAFYWVGNKK